MGYQSIDVAKGSTTAFGVQFENVADAEAGIPVKSVISLSIPYGAQQNGSCDQIWTFTGYEWVKYFFYTPNARKENEGYWVLDGDNTHTELKDDVVLKAGQSFFFVRSTKAAGSVTMAGGVAPLAETKAYEVAKGSTTAMAWPWPEAMKINDFTKYISLPYGAQQNGSCDQIWTFTGYEWIKYFFYTPNARKENEGYWVLDGDNTHTEVKDDVVIANGSAFFFVRSTKAAGTISFKR